MNLLAKIRMTESSPSATSAASTTALRAKAMRQKLLGGSLTMLAGSGLVGVTNLIYNVATARLLGPTGFAHATSVYTLLMLASAITLSFQVVCAKYVASHELDEEKASIFFRMHLYAWVAGVALALLLFLFNHAVTRYLNLPDPVLISLLALGCAFYIPLGVRRGYIQGVHAFGPLAVNFMLEGLVRLGGAYLLIEIGLGVKGAVLASVIAVIASYFLAKPVPKLESFHVRKILIAFGEGLQAIVFFSGQVVINNFDIVLVKHFFSSDQAGIYAAVSLVGRLINMCAWSVVNTMFPVSAAARSSDREARPVLFMSLGMVFLILSVLILGLWAIPSFLWKTLFGSHFELGNYGGLAALLILYAITTGIYSLSSVMITYEMSRKIANTSWVQLAFSGALVAGICVFHQTLRQVIFVQLVLMIVLLVVVALPLLRREIAVPEELRTYSHLSIVRALSEHEVIADFLRSEFHHPEFEDYRSEFEHLVTNPDLESHRENSLRRALLFLRRGAMWRELPDDTEWFHVELTRQDLARIRFFPRAQWRRVAEGSFYLSDMVECLRVKVQQSPDDEFFRKLRRMSTPVQQKLVSPTVLLIGLDTTGPLTILDGNHRMAAAMLAQPPAELENFQFICGLSRSMTRCCWYRTNVNTLSRYLTNLLRHIFYDPESDIGRFLESGS
ncbi:MAG TPA: oligosaccharide flippase family protein [Candidatus Sulfotelmatobacter sp.]|nr:oligosaccharide flippase family protein [Candidatus Sulfotelmatobacter sp.]